MAAEIAAQPCRIWRGDARSGATVNAAVRAEPKNVPSGKSTGIAAGAAGATSGGVTSSCRAEISALADRAASRSLPPTLLPSTVADFRSVFDAARNASDERIRQLENQIDMILSSTFWRITDPLRRTIDRLRRSRSGRFNSGS